MLSKLSEVDENIDDLIIRVKSQTNEACDSKIRNLLLENNLDYIQVIKKILGIEDKKECSRVKNVNREKYVQIRKFIDEIYMNNNK